MLNRPATLRQEEPKRWSFLDVRFNTHALEQDRFRAKVKISDCGRLRLLALRLDMTERAQRVSEKEKRNRLKILTILLLSFSLSESFNSLYIIL